MWKLTLCTAGGGGARARLQSTPEGRPLPKPKRTRNCAHIARWPIVCGNLTIV